MDERGYIESNKALWNEWTGIHVKSKFYDLESFKAGQLALDTLEREGPGDVAGKSLLHLQCHFGMSTLSWARLGAEVTGADFSDKAIALARSLSAELDIPATFVCADIYDLPGVLDGAGTFDIVFTSHGVLPWLPDMQRWAGVIAHFLRPGGVFYIVELHPIVYVFEPHADNARLDITYSYFHKPKPHVWETQGSYADPDAHVEHDVQYEWQHSLSDIINALIGAGLRIESLHEYPFCAWEMFPGAMEQGADGMWRLKEGGDNIPFTFALKATK